MSTLTRKVHTAYLRQWGGLDSKWNNYSTKDLETMFLKLRQGAVGTGLTLNMKLWNVVCEVFSRFLSKKGGDYSSGNLNEAISKNPDFNSFVKSFHAKFHDRIREGVGSLENDPIKFNGPVFDSNTNGLGILLHAINYTYITLDSYSEPYENGFYKADFTVHMVDAFGLDKNDLVKQGYGNKWYGGTLTQTNNGFNAWWILQNIKGYMPFKIYVDVKISIKGNKNFSVEYGNN
jgi:hypothetical protein